MCQSLHRPCVFLRWHYDICEYKTVIYDICDIKYNLETVIYLKAKNLRFDLDLKSKTQNWSWTRKKRLVSILKDPLN